MVNKYEQAKLLLKELEPSIEQLERVSEIFQEEIYLGLNAEDKVRRQTVLPMVKTFLHEVPECTNGQFLGIDLGSTNFRIILADLSHNDPTFTTESDPLPKEFYGLPCRNLYDFMAAKISEFLHKRNLEKLPLKLGYTFSFPSIQESVNSAKLITWTQTFHCPDGVGEDAGKLLQEAIDRRGDVNVTVACVLNDTTATLVAGAFVDPKCAIGVIIGTGANAAYYESMDRLKWFSEKHFPKNPPKKMIIDIECGCFGDDGKIDFIKTKYDAELDRISLHPRSYTFEKMYSGLFFGELCRIVLADLSSQDLFISSGVLPGPWQLNSTHVSPINADHEDGDLQATRCVLEKLQLLSFCDEEDIKIIHLVVRTLTKRAADIVAASLATLVRHVNQEDITIGFDGSFYRCQPHLAQYIDRRLASMCPDHKVRCFSLHDGSGRGGALAAATV